MGLYLFNVSVDGVTCKKRHRAVDHWSWRPRSFPLQGEGEGPLAAASVADAAGVLPRPGSRAPNLPGALCVEVA